VGTLVAISFFGGDLTAAWGFMILHNASLFLVYLILFITGRWNPLRKYSEEGEEEKEYAH
jgi:hypothetical protein